MARRTRPETPTTCDCPQARHEHGTAVMYKRHKCGCHDCRAAKQAYDNDYNYRTGRASQPVSADKVRAHIEWLMGEGMTLISIADASGIHIDTLSKIRNGRDRIYQDVEQLVMGVQPPPIRLAARDAWTPSVGTQRRLRGLAVLGWSIAAIAEHSGISESWIKELRGGLSVDVAKTTERRVARIASELVRRPAPNNHSARLTRAHAIRAGWISMFAYDDIDDPNETPNVTPLKQNRDEWIANRFEELHHLVNGGASPEDAAIRAGYPTLKAAIAAVKHQKGMDMLAKQLEGAA